MNNLQKLLNYCLDCVQSTQKNTAFCNIKGNKIIFTGANTFAPDNKEIIEIMTLAALNKSTMTIYSGNLLLSGQKGKNVFYSPLIYADAELIRDNDGIKLVLKDDYMLNIGLISSLLDNDTEIIENTINQLLDLDLTKIDLKKVLSGLINLDNFKIENKKMIILSKINDSSAGLITELKQILSYVK